MKKILSTLFTLVACVSLLHAAVVPPSVPTTAFGENLTWEYNNSDSVLTISVVGSAVNCSIPDFSSTNRAPWYNYDDGDPKTGSSIVRNAIKSIVFVGDITYIGTYAFDHCGVLSTVVIPASVSSIGDGAFAYCSSLTSVKALSSDTELGVKTIGASAFAQCAALTSVTIPNATSIGASAFTYCTSLTSFEIPSGATIIQPNLLKGCTNLKSVTIQSNCTKVSANAFLNCSSLRRIIYNGASAPTDVNATAFDGVIAADKMIFVGTATGFGSIWNGFKVSSLAPKNDFDDTLDDHTSAMTDLMNDGAIVDIKFPGRSFLRDGCYNTLCLPFALSDTQLADEANPLNNFSIYEITSLAYVGSLIKFEIDKVDEIEAGKPYLVKYNADPDAEPLAPLTDPEFTYVQVTADAGSETTVPGVAGGVTMKGVLKPTEIPADQNTMFLLAGNQLAWTTSAAYMKGFRAYFEFEDEAPAHAPLRSMSACIVEKADAPTDIEIVENNEMQATKVIENGTIYIIKNGVKYNVQGQVISK